MATRIDPLAVVSEAAQLGDDVVVGPFAVIEAGAVIGAGTRVLPHAQIRGATTLGRDCVVHAGAVLGDDPQHLTFDGRPTRVVVGDRCVFREGSTVHRSTDESRPTQLGDDVYVMANAHVAHDCRVGSSVVLVNGALLGGHVQVGDRAFISGGAVVHQHIRVGRLALLQGLTAASRDVPPFCIAALGVNTLYGVNVVGLRRAGMPSASIMAVRKAFRALWGRRQNLRLARDRLLAEIGGLEAALPEVRELLAFVEEAKRGVCFGPRRGRSGQDESQPT